MEVSSQQFPSSRVTTLGALPYAKGRIFTDEEYVEAGRNNDLQGYNFGPV